MGLVEKACQPFKGASKWAGFFCVTRIAVFVGVALFIGISWAHGAGAGSFVEACASFELFGRFQKNDHRDFFLENVDPFDLASNIELTPVQDVIKQRPPDVLFVPRHCDVANAFGRDCWPPTFSLFRSYEFSLVTHSHHSVGVGFNGATVGWRKAVVAHFHLAHEGARRDRVFSTLARQVGANLGLANYSRDLHGGTGRTVGLPSEKQGHKQKKGAEANDPGLNLSSVGHTLRRFVHSSLSRDVVYLPLAGLLLNALAGLFLGLFLHYLNWQRQWWPLLLSGGLASAGFGLIWLGLSA